MATQYIKPGQIWMTHHGKIVQICFKTKNKHGMIYWNFRESGWKND